MNQPAHFFDRPKPKGRPVKYPLRCLELGESIFLPGAHHRKINQVRPLHVPRKFQVRTVTENGVKGVRVRRVADSLKKQKGGRVPLYPLEKLLVGESLLMKGRDASQARDCWKWLKPRKFKAKTVTIGGVKCARVWRVE